MLFHKKYIPLSDKSQKTVHSLRSMQVGLKSLNRDVWLWYKQQNDSLNNNSKKKSWKSGLNWIGLSKVLDMRNIEILLFDFARLF